MNMMAFSLTMPQMLMNMKSVTRRAGWRTLQPGQKVMACNQRMGLVKGGTAIRIGPLTVISACREPIEAISDIEAVREGFPWLSGAEFKAKFTRTISKKGQVTRIEFRPARLENIPRMGTTVDVPVFAAFQAILRHGVIVGHVLPNKHPDRLARLAASNLGLQLPFVVPNIWPAAGAHRALVLCEDGTMAVPCAEQMEIVNHELTAATIVHQHTMDPKIRDMASWKIRADEACQRSCMG